MPVGSLVAALGLIALVHADRPAAYLAVWVLIGVAAAGIALRSRLCHARPHFRSRRAGADHGAHALAGGFASTVQSTTDIVGGPLSVVCDVSGLLLKGVCHMSMPFWMGGSP